MESIRKTSEFDQRDWRMLLGDIAQGLVVPVIGGELLTVSIDGQKKPLYEYLAECLAERLQVEHLPKPSTISDVVHAYLQDGKNPIRTPYFEIWDILRDLNCEPPEPLCQLAAIPGFTMFITTTCDNLMRQAVDKVRFGGNPTALQLSFNRSAASDDLPPDFNGAPPVVYHVFGQAANLPTYVATDDDMLNFGRLWQDERHQPRAISSFLRDKFLMVLGCSFENWLSRFFLCALKGDMLFAEKNRCGILADTHSRHDEQLTLFLSRRMGPVYSAGGAEEFIRELLERWKEYAPESMNWSAASPLGGKVPEPYLGDEFVKGSVFISYASEDNTCALALEEQLRQAGFDVWLDKHRLGAGADYRRLIFHNIEHCSIFIPIISHHVETVAERRYFRMEWEHAAEEKKMRSPIAQFIRPVVIDDARPSVMIHEEINKCTWVALEDNRLPQSFITHCRESIRQQRREEEYAR